MPKPKNYITSGISKALLTPCRRVGLSRSKKTPKNIYASPLTAIPNIEGIEETTPKKKVEVNSKVDKKNNKFNETPKKLPSPKQTKKTINRVSVDNVFIKSVEVDQAKLDSYKISIQPNNTVTQKNEKKSTLEDSPNSNLVVKTLVEAEIHQPVAKRSINFNIIEESPSISATNEHKYECVKNNLVSASIAEKNTVCSYQIKEKSNENNNFKADVINIKKRKLKLNSDDFISNENLLKHKNSPKTSTSPQNKIIKKSCTTLNESSCFTLGRFTTEDYLKDYSTNPEKFKENLEEDGLIGAIFEDNEDIEAFSSFSEIKTKTMKTEDRSTFKSKKNDIPILCPSLDQNVDDIKPKRSLSTKKYSCELKRQLEKVSTMAESKIKQKLSVSLERLTNNELKSKLESDGNQYIQIEDLPSTPEPKTTILKSIEFDEDDDEPFTSSPGNDKKQRENLLQLILNVENDIKRKHEKLEKLKQAQVYKKKHSPEKLKVSSDRWLKGCRAGLNDLLVKMQEHGPMEMETLTKKLRISDDIVLMLNL